MAKFGAWTNGFIQINGTNLSDHCEQFDIEESMGVLNFDAHGDTTAIKTQGLKEHNVNARFYTDFAATKAIAILRPLFDNRSEFPILLKPASGSTSATNPQWSGNFFVSRFKPITGRHGENLMTEITLTPTTAFTYSES